MSTYDAKLRVAKDAVTAAITELVKEAPRLTVMDLAGRVDDLNKAWDELTDCLVRQRAVRDETIERLHNMLAEVRNR